MYRRRLLDKQPLAYYSFEPLVSEAVELAASDWTYAGVDPVTLTVVEAYNRLEQEQYIYSDGMRLAGDAAILIDIDVEEGSTIPEMEFEYDEILSMVRIGAGYTDELQLVDVYDDADLLVSSFDARDFVAGSLTDDQSNAVELVHQATNSSVVYDRPGSYNLPAIDVATISAQLAIPYSVAGLVELKEDDVQYILQTENQSVYIDDGVLDAEDRGVVASAAIGVRQSFVVDFAVDAVRVHLGTTTSTVHALGASDEAVVTVGGGIGAWFWLAIGDVDTTLLGWDGTVANEPATLDDALFYMNYDSPLQLDDTLRNLARQAGRSYTTDTVVTIVQTMNATGVNRTIDGVAANATNTLSPPDIVTIYDLFDDDGAVLEDEVLLYAQSQTFEDLMTGEEYALIANSQLTVGGLASWSTTSLEFTAATAGITVGDIDITSGDYTVELWYDNDGEEGNVGLLQIGNGEVVKGAQEAMNWYINSVRVLNSGVGSIPVNGVYHIVVTKQATALKMYINGVELDSTTSAAQVAGTACKIGDTGSYTGMQGLVDALGVYDYAWLPAEVTEAYNAGIGQRVNSNGTAALDSTDFNAPQSVEWDIA